MTTLQLKSLEITSNLLNSDLSDTEILLVLENAKNLINLKMETEAIQDPEPPICDLCGYVSVFSPCGSCCKSEYGI